MADEETRREENVNGAQGGLVRRWLLRVGTVALVFLLGFVPMWWSKRGVASELDATKRDLRRCELQNAISAASVYARRGEYEPGRQHASSFFSDLQAELDRAESTLFTVQEKTLIPGLLSGRDDVITLLSRSDPASADRLSDMYVAYRAITSVKTPQ